MLEKNRFEHILFFPDRKGVGLKQVQALIAKADDKDATVDGRFEEERSTAEPDGAGIRAFRHRRGNARQGQGRLPLPLRRSNRRQYRTGLAELSGEWDNPNGVRKSWASPGKGSDDFADGKEAITALLGILVHGAGNVRDQRLESFYKGDIDAARPKMAIYWRSGNTWTSDHRQPRGSAGRTSLAQKAGMADLLPADQRPTADKLDTLLKTLVATAPTIKPDIEAALADPAERAKIDELLSESRDLTTGFSDKYGGAIGLSAGFSFSDGD